MPFQAGDNPTFRKVGSTSMSKNIVSVWVACAMTFVAAAGGCGGGESAPPPDSPAIAAVRATIKPDVYEKSRLATEVNNPKGAGKVVMFGNAAYLVKDSAVFAINEQAKMFSPGVPQTKEVQPADVVPQ